MSASPTLPFIDLPETRRQPARHESDKGVATAPARAPAPMQRHRAIARTGLRPRPLVPTSLDEALQLGKAVVAARLAPRGMETPEACMIAILHGLEVGLSPMQALQRIAVVNGRPTIWGDGALALVQASGLAVSIIETIGGETPDSWVATCTVLRRGEAQVVSRQFSAQDAKRARLWGRPGPWSEFPQRMLQMRARAFALRDVFADVLGGLYLHEEFVDEDEGSMAWPATPEPADGDAAAKDAQAQPNTSDRVATTPEADTRVPVEAPPAAPASAGRARRKAPRPPWVTNSVGPSQQGQQERHSELIVAAIAVTTGSGANRGDAKQDDQPAERPAMPLPPQRLRSMDLRLRRPSGTAARRRFNEHWEVRRPQTLGEGKPRFIPARHRKTDPAVRAPSPLSGQPGQDEAPRQEHTVPLTPADELTLLDDALCCALDPTTLDEIVEEFAHRLDSMSGEVRRMAEVVIDRHRARVDAAGNTGLPEVGGNDA